MPSPRMYGGGSRYIGYDMCYGILRLQADFLTARTAPYNPLRGSRIRTSKS